MQQVVEPPGGVPVRKALLDAAVAGFCLPFAPMLLPAAQGQILIPGNLAQPHPQLTVPAEGVDGGQGPEEGLLGHLLRCGRISGQRQHIPVYVGEVSPVDLLKVRFRYLLTAFRTFHP